MAKPLNEEWIAEEELARLLGVNRSVLREARPSLGSGEVDLRGNVLYWQKKVATATAARLGLATTALENKKNGADAGAAATAKANGEEPLGELMTVASVPGPGGYHFSNHFLIRARRANEEVVVVRVKDSRKYRPQGQNGKPMTLRAVPADEGTWWVHVGREPRFVGAY